MNNGFIIKINKKFAGFLGVILVLIIIPVTVYVAQQSQQVQQNAAVFSAIHDSCKLITISAVESPTCTRLTQSNDGNNTCTVPDTSKKNTNIADYTYTLSISSNDGKQHTVKYSDLTSFCTHGYGDLRGSTKDCHCSDNTQSSGEKTLSISSSGSQLIQMHRSPTQGYASCGAYQFDVTIVSVDGKSSCSLTANQLGNTLSVGHCDTGIDCSPVTPTPTSKSPTVTPVPSPTPTVPPGTTPTACVTPGKVSNVKITCPACLSPTPAQ